MRRIKKDDAYSRRGDGGFVNVVRFYRRNREPLLLAISRPVRTPPVLTVPLRFGWTLVAPAMLAGTHDFIRVSSAEFFVVGFIRRRRVMICACTTRCDWRGHEQSNGQSGCSEQLDGLC